MTQGAGRNGIVLLALDGSPGAATAVPLARAVADQLGGTLEVLHVVTEPTETEQVRARLALDTAGELTLRIEVGDAAEAILGRVADPRIAVVVLTTHGRAVDSDARLGRVTEAVIARSEEPVLLVRPETAAGWSRAGRGLHRLLLPLDGSPTTAVVLRPATWLCGQLRASIDLLYVAPSSGPASSEPGIFGAPQYVDQPQHEWSQWADEVLERLLVACATCPPEVGARAYLATGDPADEVVRFATEHDHDAIILARRSRLEPGRAATLRGILNRAPCPIVLVGAAAEESRASGG